ncbi:MAG: Gfo/Idh/MocA family oxidoreductase [Gemmataceae bacterium]
MLSRRHFLASSLALPALAPFSKISAQRADSLRVAVIGIANRGADNLAGVAHEKIVALCDVDPAHSHKARGQFPQAEYFTDYRQMFDKMAKEIDAVVVSTPDHTHAHAALLAMSLGKPTYCEKPLARTVGEVRRMRNAAQKHKVITQMGTQIHAENNYRRVVEIVQSGLLGPIETVHVWLGNGPPNCVQVEKGPKIPFDIAQWQGPTTNEFFYADVSKSGHKFTWPHFNWRYFWEYGGGQLGDFGCHFMDLPFWALGLGAPTRVQASGQGRTPEVGVNEVPVTMDVEYQFPAREKAPAVTLHWSHGFKGPKIDGERKPFAGYGNGVLFIGKNGSLVADYSRHKLMPDEFAKDVKRPEQSIPKSLGHHKEWLAAIRGNGKTLCNFDYSGNLAEAVLLGNVAYRAQSAIEWDSANLKATNSGKANELIDPAPRKGWEYPV